MMVLNLNKICYLVSDASLYGSGASILQIDNNGNPAICDYFFENVG